jgi:ribosomal protein L37E
MSEEPFFFAIEVGAIILGVPFLGLSVVALVLGVRDTFRQRGKWGINLKPVVCTQCGTPMPMVRKPASLNQALWGGGTCAECGFELDKYGRPVQEQNTLVKWAVLRAVEDSDKRQHRPRHREERILKVNDQTQRGDALWTISHACR